MEGSAKMNVATPDAPSRARVSLTSGTDVSLTPLTNWREVAWATSREAADRAGRRAGRRVATGFLEEEMRGGGKKKGGQRPRAVGERGGGRATARGAPCGHRPPPVIGRMVSWTSNVRPGNGDAAGGRRFPGPGGGGFTERLCRRADSRVVASPIPWAGGGGLARPPVPTSSTPHSTPTHAPRGAGPAVRAAQDSFMGVEGRVGAGWGGFDGRKGSVCCGETRSLDLLLSPPSLTTPAPPRPPPSSPRPPGPGGRAWPPSPAPTPPPPGGGGPG